MRFSYLLSAFLAIPCAYGSKLEIRDKSSLVPLELSSKLTTAEVIPKAYIVQLKAGFHLAKRGSDSHSQFHKRASSVIDYATRKEFKNPDVFFGLSIQVNDDANETTIQQIPDVLKVWPVKVIPRPQIGRVPDGNTTTSTITTQNVSPKAGSKAQVNFIHEQTEVDRVHALGIKGKGIKIAIMDTGVDYRHDALGGGFGEGFKISFGRDFIGDFYDDTFVLEPDDDPFDFCPEGSPGTHATGIIGMQDPENSPFGLVGVAPEATLGMYRIFPCYLGAPMDVIIEAFLQAANDKVDILSIGSLSASVFWEIEDPFSMITASLEAQGIAIVAPNGNLGNYNSAVTSPAMGKGVIGVGAVQNSHFPTVYGFKDSRGRSMKYSGDPWPLIAPSTGLTVFDFGEYYKPSTPGDCSIEGWGEIGAAATDKQNSIVAIPYIPYCSFDTLIARAQEVGFIYTLTYASTEADIFRQDYTAQIPWPPYQSITINTVDSKTLLGGLAASKKNDKEYRVYFDSVEFESHDQNAGGLMSNFSSFGPTRDVLSIKPQVSAPGQMILSTWSLEKTGYALLSGTSMATAYVSGSLALLKSQFPDETVQQLRERLQSSADPIQYAFNENVLAPVGQQGGGLINVYNAIYYESIVTPSELNLGDLDQLKPREITIENKTGRSKTYVITHEPAAEFNMQPSLILPDGYLGEKVSMQGVYPSYADVKFSTTSIKIKGGESATFIVTIAPPQDIPEAFLPVYSGFIKITNNYEVFRVAYLGQPYSRYDALYIDDGALSGTNGAGLYRFNSSQQWDLVNTGIVETDFYFENYPVDLLSVDFIRQQTSEYFRMDIVPYNTSTVPDFYGFELNESNPHGVPDTALPLMYPSKISTGIYAGVETFGTMGFIEFLETPDSYSLLVQSEVYHYNETFVTLPNGDYRALLRILKWGGERDVEKDYQSWLSPVIRVKRAL